MILALENIIKMFVVTLLFIPALLLTLLIWIFGGWTMGDEMPNPLYNLIDWTNL